MVFKNKNRNYLIREVFDDVPNVSYRSGLKEWIDTTAMVQWLEEGCVIFSLSNKRQRVFFLDNCSGLTRTKEMVEDAETINTEVL